MSIKRVSGDLTTSQSVIRCQQVDCQGSLNSQTGQSIHQVYPEAAEAYQRLCTMFGSKLLGEVSFFPCHDNTMVAFMFVLEYDDMDSKLPETNPTILEECLYKVAEYASNMDASIGIQKQNKEDPYEGTWDYDLLSDFFSNSDIPCLIVESNNVQPAMEKKAGQKPGPQPTTNQKLPEVTFYASGNCIESPGAGSWSCLLVDNRRGIEKPLSGSCEKTNKERMELTAIVAGFHALARPCNVTVYSDSASIVDAISKGWLAVWKQKNWATLENADLWQELDSLLMTHTAYFIHAKANAYRKVSNKSINDKAKG